MKRIISIFLAVLTLFVISGCANDKGQVKTLTATLYFPDENLEFGAEKRSFSSATVEKDIVEAVIEGPVTDTLTPSLKGNIKVLSATMEGDMCVVDLSKEFPENNTGGSLGESIAIYSIVNSLCSVEYINCVKINIEGDEAYEFGGHFMMEDPFYFEPNMVRIEDR